jgi:hypothetical protein
MTIIVEDGTGVTGANSYVSEATLTTYATARGTTIPTADREMYLILAMDYLESLQFIGIKKFPTPTQILQWPRYDVVIDTYYVTANTLPPELIKVQCEIALAIYNGNNPLQDRPRHVISEKVGTIEVHYSQGSSSIVLPVKITALLWKLVGGGGTGGFKVSKA